MVKIKKIGPIALREYIKEKKIIVFGAGRALNSALDNYFETKDLEFIIDNNSNKWGQSIVHRKKDVPITGVERLHDIGKLSDYLIFITSPFYAAEIVEQLDQIHEIDGIECCLQVLVRKTKESVPDFSFTSGEQKIPKKIHYIWVGGNPLSRDLVDNIETWRKYNPDFEIIRWDESNYDFSKCDYTREAYESKEWGFVPNHARLDIIYKHGGIYLDTDVRALKSFDCLLKDDAFFNMGSADSINQGCGFGAVPGNEIIKEMRDVFANEHFVSREGTPIKKSCSSFLNPVLKKHHFNLINVYQKIDSVVLYPCEVMSPQTMDGMENFYSDKTLSVHLENATWQNEEETRGMNAVRRIIANRLN